MLKKTMDDFENQEPGLCPIILGDIRNHVERTRKALEEPHLFPPETPSGRDVLAEDSRRGIETCDAVSRKLDELERRQA